MNKRRQKKLLAILIVAGAFVTAAWFIYGYYLQREARLVLDDVRHVSFAGDHDAAFATLRQKYGDRLKAYEGCSAERCSYYLTVSNHLLSTIFRTPYAELNARFDLRGKSVRLIIVDYRSAQTGGESPVVHIQTDVCDRCDWFFVHPWDESSTSELWNGIVEMGVATAPQLRQAALALNPDCLTRLRGCTDIAQLLPTVWQSSTNGIRCVVANRKGQAQ